MTNTTQNYTIMMVGEHGIQTFEVVVVVLLFLMLLFGVFVPTSAHPLLSLDNDCPTMLKCKSSL